MPTPSYSLKMTWFCDILSVPSSVVEMLQSVCHNDEAAKRIGCEIATEMCLTILTLPLVFGGEGFYCRSVRGWILFVTLNLECSTKQILAN